ncbi:MAG: helix-turn-helix transcriptional regulator [Roseburia sp.]|nr:helix-turn-helix transcriptional regulator [Roseburia sp.]
MKKELTAEQREQILRLRKVRENLGFSQEQFAHILGISISAYKKIEAYENQISLANLKKIYRELNVSVDYILFGVRTSQEDLWKAVLNCTETDKMMIFLRLVHYFSIVKHEIFPTEDGQLKNIENFLHYIDDMQAVEKKDAT